MIRTTKELLAIDDTIGQLSLFVKRDTKKPELLIVAIETWNDNLKLMIKCEYDDVKALRRELDEWLIQQEAQHET